MSGRGGRAPSGPWSRLKPANLDPLESYGLPSKGDNRLLDFKTQERYYTKIVDRYMSFCSQAGRGDELLRRLSAVHLENPSTSSAVIASPSPTPTPIPIPPSTIAAAATAITNSITSSSTLDPGLTITNAISNPQASNDLAVLVMATRKLREAIVATSRADTFSTQAYMFSIRLGILLKQPEAYHAALLYLLRTLHARSALSSSDLAEFGAYLVLDLACRQGDLAAAYAARAHYRLRDPRLAALLAALVHDDYWAFWRVARAVDAYRARLIESAEQRVRLHALKCLARSYLALDVAFVESVAGGRPWSDLVRLDNVGWLRQGSNVVLRKAKGS